MQNGLSFIPVNKIPPTSKQLLAEGAGVVKSETVESQLSSHISTAWERNRNAKRENIEIELLNDLRAKKGEYTNEELANIREQGGSEIYMMLTNAKIRGLKAWLRDIIIPAGDKAWEIDPTPMPDLPTWAEKEIAQRVRMTMNPQGEQQSELMTRIGKLRDMVITGLREDSKKRAERMSTKIDDQLVEGGWEEALDQFNDDFCTFSAGIIKGPVKHKRKKLSWGHDESQNVVPIPVEVIQREVKRVSPFDCYPSPEAETPDDGEFIEHIRLSRRELRSFLDVEGYSNKAISDVLEEYGRGGLREWLWLDHERKTLEGKDNWWMKSDEGLLDGLHFWGSVQGKMLIEWGIKEKGVDRLGEYEIDAIKIGRHIIRAVINKDPLARRPYQKACFDPIPGSFWGNSLRYLMRDIQKMCNATARAISNNVGMASGPMVEVHEDRLAKGEVLEIYPWKVFQTTRGDTTGSSQNVNFYQPKLNAHELLRVYEEFERRADDATGVPRYALGNDKANGAGRTSSGLAMLMNSASRGIKSAVSQIDLYITRKVVEKYYYFNMIEDDDPMIKGDVSVVARGATALLVKEQAHAQRLEFMQLTSNPMDMQIIGEEGRAKMLREHSKVLDMPNLIPDDDEFKARIAEKQNKQQPNPDMLKLEIDKSKLDQDQKYNEGKLKLDREDIQVKRFVEESRQKSEAELQQRKIESEERINREKLQSEERIKIQIEKLRLADKEKQDRVNLEANHTARNNDIRNIMKMLNDIKSMRPENQERLERDNERPSEVHVHIDGKNGNVTKRISIDKRDDSGKVQQMTSEEVN